MWQGQSWQEASEPDTESDGEGVGTIEVVRPAKRPVKRVRTGTVEDAQRTGGVRALRAAPLVHSHHLEAAMEPQPVQVPSPGALNLCNANVCMHCWSYGIAIPPATGASQSTGSGVHTGEALTSAVTGARQGRSRWVTMRKILAADISCCVHAVVCWLCG